MYTSFKADWRKVLDRAKRESELAPGKEPKWYKILNPVFTETNEDLEITRNSADVSFSLSKGDDENDISEKESFQESDSRSDEETPCSSKVKMKLVVASHKKRKVVRSQNQALSHMAKGMEDLASSQIKRAKLMIEADRKRDELFLKHKEEEAKRNKACSDLCYSSCQFNIKSYKQQLADAIHPTRKAKVSTAFHFITCTIYGFSTIHFLFKK